jgi:hypothetical protein
VDHPEPPDPEPPEPEPPVERPPDQPPVAPLKPPKVAQLPKPPPAKVEKKLKDEKKLLVEIGPGVAAKAHGDAMTLRGALVESLARELAARGMKVTTIADDAAWVLTIIGLEVTQHTTPKEQQYPGVGDQHSFTWVVGLRLMHDGNDANFEARARNPETSNNPTTAKLYARDECLKAIAEKVIPRLPN